MPVQITVTGQDGIEAAAQLGQFISAIVNSHAIATANVAAVEPEPKKAAKKAKPAPVVEDDEEEAPAPKAKVKKPVVEEDEEDEVPAPKKKAAKPAPVEDDEDEEEEAPKPKAKAKTEGKSSVGELKDDGKEQPATIDGCRIMIRRVARAAGCGTEYAQAVLAEFAVDGATKVPPKKMQAFIDRCQEVIDEPDSLEVESAE